MVKLAAMVTTFTLLATSTAMADILAGEFQCSDSKNQLIWQTASPSDLLVQGSTCGFSSSGLACPTTADDLLSLVKKKGCKGGQSGDSVLFVCNSNENKLKKLIADFCQALLP
jgi:hypothetical protein